MFLFISTGKGLVFNKKCVNSYFLVEDNHSYSFRISGIRMLELPIFVPFLHSLCKLRKESAYRKAGVNDLMEPTELMRNSRSLGL